MLATLLDIFKVMFSPIHSRAPPSGTTVVATLSSSQAAAKVSRSLPTPPTCQARNRTVLGASGRKKIRQRSVNGGGYKSLRGEIFRGAAKKGTNSATGVRESRNVRVTSARGGVEARRVSTWECWSLAWWRGSTPLEFQGELRVVSQHKKQDAPGPGRSTKSRSKAPSCKWRARGFARIRELTV